MYGKDTLDDSMYHHRWRKFKEGDRIYQDQAKCGKKILSWKRSKNNHIKIPNSSKLIVQEDWKCYCRGTASVITSVTAEDLMHQRTTDQKDRQITTVFPASLLQKLVIFYLNCDKR